MLCEKCGKNIATTHIKSVINGKVTEHCYCDLCAAKSGLQNSETSVLGQMLSSIFSGDDFLPEKGKSCPLCGTCFSEIANTGKVGCAECYQKFYDEFLPYIKRVQGGFIHVGKKPVTQNKKKDTLLEMRKELEKLIKQEKFEEAAVLRDKIKEIKVQNL